jgi:hypothetical protein
MKKAIVEKTGAYVNDDATVEYISMKGKFVEVKDLDKEFLSHKFSSETLKTMFWAQFETDYIGG